MTRAPSPRGDKLKVSALDNSGPIDYPLASIPNNVSYETVSDQQEAEPNQPLSIPLSFHNGIAYSTYTSQQAGAFFSDGMICDLPGVMRAPLLQTAVTLTGAANPVQYFFEATVNDSGADDGQPVLYAIAIESGEVNVYKISLDNGDFGTLLNTKTFTVTTTQPMGRPVEWNNGSATEWYLGLGDNGKINKLTSIVSGTSADTWSTGTNTADARHLKVVGNRLMRSTNENQISLLPRAGDPTDESEWGSDFFVGDVSANITELGEAGGLAYIAKTDGFYEWDTVGQAVNIFPEIGKATRNGQGMVYWHGGFLIPAASGLWWTRTGQPVGPDSNPNNKGFDPSFGSSNIHKQGRWMGLHPFGKYIFAMYTAGPAAGYLYYGREREQGDPVGWGPIVWQVAKGKGMDFDNFHGCFVTETSEVSSTETRPFVWATQNDDLHGYQLDKDGGLNSTRGEIDIQATARVFSGLIDFGLPNVLKQLHVIDGWSEDSLGGNSGFDWTVYRDGGSQESVGSRITTDGFFQRFWTQDTADTAYAFLVRLSWAGSNETDTNGPHLRDAMVRAVALPNTTREWTFLLAVEDEEAKTAKKIRSELEGYVGDLKQYTLPDKDTFNGVMGKPRLLRADEISALTPRNLDPPHYVIAASVREMSGS